MMCACVLESLIGSLYTAVFKTDKILTLLVDIYIFLNIFFSDDRHRFYRSKLGNIKRNLNQYTRVHLGY